MAKAAISPAPQTKRFRIARTGQSRAYSVQFSVDGKVWRDGVGNLDLKYAQAQLKLLRDHGCRVQDDIATI